MPANIFKYDIGTILRFPVIDEAGAVVDLTGFSVANIHFVKPSGNLETRAASVPTPADGVCIYTTIANDLDEAGTWTAEVELMLPTGSWSSDVVTFPVLQPIYKD